MNRRAMLNALLGAATFAAGGIDAMGATGTIARADTPRRIIVLDWGLTELTLSIGVVPVGMANVPGFRRNFTACPVPDSVVDLGLMFQPNMELMLALKPDLIVITPAHASMRASLERIAPTVTLDMLSSSETPYVTACAETLQLARRFDCVPRGEAVVAQANRTLDAARARLAALPAARDASVYMVRFVDESHLRVYGSHSLYGELLTTLGLRNGWRHAPQRAPYSIIGFDALDATGDATLVYVKPLPASTATMMKASRVWQAMPFSKDGRMIGMAGAPAEGGILSAQYFANALVDAFSAAPARTPEHA
ncbi:ABC transporter substrate-binding protein [Paraburkholderia sp.]|uniref:ABC transporter substrate-binding protein n=1 Tax=Paraburkholderia sp. TaxID=1926495 RepID=UPI00239F91E7|nr:ABC transporter substrate-binding protein [Paraburkholderia sp.]MDE1182638.1 ABC transporter substrate-binding protein [Paraburkholderia sp.]